MATLLPIAAGAEEGLIWLIIAAFWVVAQVISRRGKKGKGPPVHPPRPQQGRPSPPAPPQKQVEEELKEFLKGLTGQTAPPVEPVAPPPPVQRTAPTTAQRAPKPRIRVKAPAQERPQRRVEPQPARPRPAFAKAKSLKVAPSAFDTHPVVSPRSFLVGLQGLKMPIMSVPLTSHYAIQAPPPIAENFRGRKALRQSILCRVVLGAPKALALDEYNLQTGMM